MSENLTKEVLERKYKHLNVFSFIKLQKFKYTD